MHEDLIGRLKFALEKQKAGAFSYLFWEAIEALSAQPDAGSGGDARAQFEAWAQGVSFRASNIDVTRHGSISDWYVSDLAALTWRCWQAALAARQPVGVQPIDFCPFCGGDKGHWEGCRAPVTAEALGTGYGLPKPSIHAADHYSAFLKRDAQKHTDSAKARALNDTALVIDLLGLEIRRLHQELVETSPAPAAVPVDWPREWRFAISKAIETLDFEAEHRAGGGFDAEAASMRRAMGILQRMAATHPQPAAAP